MPLNSVKARIQLDPVTYNRGLIGGFRQVIQNELLNVSFIYLFLLFFFPI